MRNGCSRDLLDPAHLIRDFDVVWLEVRGVRACVATLSGLPSSVNDACTVLIRHVPTALMLGLLG